MKRNHGFTLIEMLIVVLIIGILAMVIIPVVMNATEDAKEATLQKNLQTLRRAVTIYHSHHNGTYPGVFAADASGGAGGSVSVDGNDLEWYLQTPGRIFAAQLTAYTDVNGNPSKVKTDRFRYGPYIRESIPENPFNEKNDVLVDTETDSIVVRDSDGRSGWKFYALTGVLIANDGEHDDL